MGLIEAVVPARLGPEFRKVLASQWATNLGDGISLAAAPLLIAGATDDPLLVAGAVFVQRAPWLLIGLQAGVLADRLDRRRLLVAANAARALVLALLVAAVASDSISPALILVTFFVLALAEVLADTTAGTILPMVVKPDDLTVGNARLQFGFMALNQLAGPALGGALFAIGREVPFLAQATIMAFGALVLARLRLPDAERPERGQSIRRDIVDGARWMWGHGAMRTLAITIIVFNVTFGASFSLLVVLASERLDLGELGFGMLTASTAVGGAVGAALFGSLERLAGHTWIMRIGLIIESLTHLVLAVTTTAWIAFAALVAFGVHIGCWSTIVPSVRQRVVPEPLQGRVHAVYMVGLNLGLLIGAALGGLLARIGDITWPYWFAFGGSAVTVALIWRPLQELSAPA